MAINTSSKTQTKVGLKIIKDDNSVWTNPDGLSDLGEFVVAVTIEEGIDSPAISAELILTDGAGLVNKLTGSETWRITIETGAKNTEESSKNIYNFRAYNIDSRARHNQKEVYNIQMISYEFLLNEAYSLFGSADTIFKKGTKSNEIVEDILRGNVTGNPMTEKKLFAEETQNDQKFVCVNWRPFDVIYFLANRSIRKTSAGEKSQNGFIFWENVMGYHFKSIDQMIKDINDQSAEENSNPSKGKARLYTYGYQPKRAGDEDSDGYRIDSIVFPEDRNILKTMRNGSYAGFSTALDPSKFNNSKLSKENKQSQGPGSYDIEDFWGDMEHIGKESICPVTQFDDNVKTLVKSKRRIRFTPLPNRLFDPKDQTDEQSENTQNLDELAYLDAYKHLRVASLKSTKLLITIPGNLDLYAGYGIKIFLPETKAKDGKLQTDKKYSGVYCIAALKHNIAEGDIHTELLLYRDGLPKQK